MKVTKNKGDKKRLMVVLTVDCERFISFSQTNPRWSRFERFKGKINSLIKNFRYNEKGYEILIDVLLKEKFPATLMFVHKIFGDKLDLPKFIEIGDQTKNHLPLTLISDEKLREEISNPLKTKSITAPMWMVEDRKNPGRVLKELKKNGYTHTVYRGENEGTNHWHHNAVKKPVNKYGIKLVHVSACFEGNSSKEHIQEIKRNLLGHVNQDEVFLITTHDFTHKNNKNLLEIISFLKKLEAENKIKIVTLSKT